MKPLNEYLSTKGKIKDGFPEELSKSAIIDFLKANGFTHIKIHNPGYTDAFNEFSKEKHKCYMLGDFDENIQSHYIIISKGGVPTKENPFYIVRTKDVNWSNFLKVFGYYRGGNKDMIYQFNTYEEFINDINSFFNWKKIID